MLRKQLFFRIILGLALIGILGPGGGVARGQGPAPQGDPSPAAACGGGVSFGVVCEGGLGSASEVDSYSFSGSTNDVITVRIQRTAGAMTPSIGIYNAGNTLLSDCARAASPRTAFTCSLTESGSFTVRVWDYYGASTGSYRIFVQRLNAMGNTRPLSFGRHYSADIASNIEGDAFTFSAQINDTIELRARRSTGDFTPYLSVYNDSGVEVCLKASSPLAHIPACTLDATGTYTIFVQDYYLQNTGSYQLLAQRLGNPGEAQALTIGQVTTGSISSTIDIDTYRFNATINDQIILRARRDSGTMTGYLRLYNASSELICDHANAPLAVVEPCTIPATGAYFLLVGDYYIQQTGTYTLHTQRLNNPGGAQSLQPGRAVSGGIDRPAALDTFTFMGQRDDEVSLALSRSSGSFTPYLRVYDTGGALICYNARSPAATIDSCVLPADGRYTVIADDYYRSSVGNYTLLLGCVSGSCQNRIFLPLLRRN